LAQKITILVRQEGLGHVGPQDGAFSIDMFDRFLHTLESQPVKPVAICFYTDGVKLTCEGSRAVPGLQLIQGMGVRLMICRTCLEYLGLMGKVAVGEVSTMTEIVKTLTDADSVITA
jgi:sulfur relay (sulfurtransferase) complex TusBCD TusD component (DsrE family)